MTRALWCVLLLAAPAWSQTFGSSELLGTLECAEIDESSGLAASHAHPDVLWTHNDSGDDPRLFALDARDGAHRGEVLIRGARARDWEDMASFTRDGRHWLLVADVGDNRGRRDTKTLYLIEEPADLGAETQEVAAAVRIQYADGNRDCEGVAVDTARGEVVLVSKERRGDQPRVYTLPLSTFEAPPAEPVVLEPVAVLTSVPVLTTALEIHPDGSEALILSYGDAYLFRRAAEEDWPTAFGRAPEAIRLPRRAQGETLCFDAAGEALYLTSEERPTPLLRLPRAPD